MDELYISDTSSSASISSLSDIDDLSYFSTYFDLSSDDVFHLRRTPELKRNTNPMTVSSSEENFHSTRTSNLNTNPERIIPTKYARILEHTNSKEDPNSVENFQINFKRTDDNIIPKAGPSLDADFFSKSTRKRITTPERITQPKIIHFDEIINPKASPSSDENCQKNFTLIDDNTSIKAGLSLDSDFHSKIAPKCIKIPENILQKKLASIDKVINPNVVSISNADFPSKCTPKRKISPESNFRKKIVGSVASSYPKAESTAKDQSKPRLVNNETRQMVTEKIFAGIGHIKN